MINVGITGSKGLIGSHLQYYLHRFNDIRSIPVERNVFSSASEMLNFVSECDVIVHLAGLNRGDDDEVFNTNTSITNNLILALKEQTRCRHVIFSSSIHSGNDSAYGRSKKKCSGDLKKWADQHSAVLTNYVLPHVFGESGIPYNNSVVSTFCHQLAENEDPVIINNADLELLHAQDVAQNIYRSFSRKENSDLRMSGASINVEELLEKLKYMSRSYDSNIIPDVTEKLDLSLFNTYRSYLFPRLYPRNLSKMSDDRGELFEAIKCLNAGQSFISTTKPGITRGNHYHSKKIERFLVLQGDAIIRIRNILSDEIIEYVVNGESPSYIDMPTFHTHNITNTGDNDLITLFWANEIFDPEQPDTFAEIV